MIGKKTKVLASYLILCALILSISVIQAMIPTRAELAANIAILKNMPGDQLKAKFAQDLDDLKKWPQGQTQKIDVEESITQLPVFKIPLLKATLAELQKRHLISEIESEEAMKIISEKEALRQTAAKTSILFPKQAKQPYLSLEFYKDTLAKMSTEEIIAEIKHLQLESKDHVDRTMMINMAKEELARRSQKTK